VVQCKKLNIPFYDAFPLRFEDNFDVIVDAVFGFSFKPQGGIRSPFDAIIEKMRVTKLPIVAIDVPSGWDVEKGAVENVGIRSPQMLVSLTAPKLCAKFFRGTHYLGGRFVPPELAGKYQLNLPPYPGSESVVKLR